jgi:CubicO group peptidase (beta-lactamase class C family)
VGHTFRTAAAALVAIVVCGQQGGAQQQSLTIGLFERYLDALRVEAGMPGLSAAIVENGTVVWDRGFGRQDVENAVAARADTPYPVLGLTETVASAMLLQQCVEQRDLELTDTARRWNSAFPDATSTIGEVLRHRSGGTFRYDPSRYAELAEVITQCARERYQRLVGYEVISRLGMTDSVPGHNIDSDRSLFGDDLLARFTAALRRVAVPYRVENNRVSRSAYTPHRLDASTGLVSTVRDLARLDRSWNVLLSSSTLEQWWSPASGAPTGLGWFVQHYNHQTVVWHFGVARDAYSSLILKVPGKNVTLILLANSDRLSAPYALENGDVTQSVFARLFLRLVLP